jgi:hypothetical protein
VKKVRGEYTPAWEWRCPSCGDLYEVYDRYDDEVTCDNDDCKDRGPFKIEYDD